MRATHPTHSLTAAPGLTLTNDQLARVAPSVFATAAHGSRSDRYAYIPTGSIVDRLRAEGFAPVKVDATRVRAEDRTGFGKHMIRFRFTGTSGIQVGGVAPEVVLVNSHDGTSSYRIVAGLIRFACYNGLVLADEGSQEIRVQHTGSRIVEEVVGASYKILEQAKLGVEAADRWGRVQLDDRERLALAAGAHQLRFGDAEGNVETPITPEQLLRTRRPEDRPNDLWTTFNRVQENVIKGGLHGQAVSKKDGRRRGMTTREVKGIDGNLNLNRALWRMAEVLAGRKGEPAPAAPAEATAAAAA